ncbi:unnamed protein product, partial [Prunus brigantina]
MFLLSDIITRRLTRERLINHVCNFLTDQNDLEISEPFREIVPLKAMFVKNFGERGSR